MEVIQALQTALLLIRTVHIGDCTGSGPSPSILPGVSILWAVWWGGLCAALKLCHPCCGLLTINKSNSVSSETARAQLTVDWCLVARSSFINCIKTAARALSLDARKSRLIRSVARADSSGYDNPVQSFFLPCGEGSCLTLFPWPKRFSGVQRIDFYATAFLSLGMLIEHFSFYYLLGLGFIFFQTWS